MRNFALTAHICVFCLVFSLAQPTLGDLVGLAVSAEVIDEGRLKCQVFAEFEHPLDLLVYVGPADIITDDPDGFFQHPLGSDTPPLLPMCEFDEPLFESLCDESFVTLGGWWVDSLDYTDTDLAWNTCTFNCLPNDPPCPQDTAPPLCGHVVGGWFLLDPPSSAPGPGHAGEDLQIWIGQFTVNQQYSVTGELTLWVSPSGPGGTAEIAGLAFECSLNACPSDLDENDEVGASDLAILLSAWGPNPGHPADFNADDTVNASDLAILLGSWGPCM